ncbi:uncharacterized protein LOC123510763 [Portunus trituberculatus]|uniref:uncharacterized protein LOC123510763 n=1 Tax=Portunus trituberculatus TaxID=210409 RepID=UPI001E1D0190|nr:uncharacterized protein LOC123510763 [Portunus trituberculatus]
MCGRHRAAWAALALCLWSSMVWVGAGEGRRTRLVTKAAGKEEAESLPRPGASTREREIAAIFRGVAYGAPTTTTSTTSSTTTTTTTATSTSVSTITHPTATSPPLRRRQEGGSVQAPPARDGPGLSASRRDEEQWGGGGGSSAAPPVAGGAGVVNSTAVSLGPAWSARVYLTGGLFGAVGVAAMCLMPRAAAASPLLAAPHHLSLLLLVLAAAACRCLHLLHAAPHFTQSLPPALLTAAEESAWPLLTAGLAVVVGGALRAWVIPARPRMALVLAGAAAAHLTSLAVTHLGVVLLQAPYEPLSVAASAVAIAFGAGVGVAGLFAVWPLGRGRSVMGELQELSGDSCSGPAPPTQLLGVAAFLQLVLSGARLYFLAIPPSFTPAWAWWCRATLPHALELAVGAMLLAAAACTSQSAGVAACGCCQKRTAEVVHPSAVKMVHPLGVYTVEEVAAPPPKNQQARTLAALSVSGAPKLKHRDHKSLDYVTSDFQLVWSHVRPLAAPHTAHDGDAQDDFLTLTPDKQPDLPRAHLLPLAPAGVLGPEMFTCSLPSYRLYAAAAGTPYHGRGGAAAQPMRHSATLSRGSSGRVYSSPQASLRASRSWDELSTSHIYEEPQRATSGSVEEALSDLSDLLTDCPSDPASPDPPPPRRRPPQPFYHSSSTLTVPHAQPPARAREPFPLPTTSSPPSHTVPPTSAPPNPLHPPKTPHTRL